MLRYDGDGWLIGLDDTALEMPTSVPVGAELSGEQGGDLATTDLRRLSTLLRAHDPNPGFAFSADWNMVVRNRSAEMLAGLLMDGFYAEHGAALPLDMVSAVSHPGGLLSHAEDPIALAGTILAEFRAEQWTRPLVKGRIDTLEKSLARRLGDAVTDPEHHEARPDRPFGFNVGDTRLAFYRMLVVPGLPRDITDGSLRMELWYAADDATRAVLVRFGREGRRQGVGQDAGSMGELGLGQDAGVEDATRSPPEL